MAILDLTSIFDLTFAGNSEYKTHISSSCYMDIFCNDCLNEVSQQTQYESSLGRYELVVVILLSLDQRLAKLLIILITCLPMRY